MVSAPSGGGSVSGGTLLGPALVVSLWGAVGPAVRRAAISAWACTAVASVIAVRVPLGGAGPAVGCALGPARRLYRRRGTAVFPGHRLTHRRYQQCLRRLADHAGGRPCGAGGALSAAS